MRGLLCAAAFLFLEACNSLPGKISWKVTLSEDDKRPYGSYIAHETLSDFFPNARLTDLSKNFRYSHLNEKLKEANHETSLLIAVGLDLYISDFEAERLIAFAESGNDVIIFTRALDEKLRQKLGFDMAGNGYEEMPLQPYYDGKDNIDLLAFSADTNKKYGYQGHSLDGFFQIDNDTNLSDEELEERLFSEEHNLYLGLKPEVLGLAQNRPNFLRYDVGKGHIYLHAAPLVMSNYFLLQKNNINYLQNIWNYVSKDIRHIYWHSYFKRTTSTSDLGVLLRYPAMRLAFWLALLTLILFIIFEGRRKQRIIPVIEPLQNSSVSFAETIGTLYYNKADHTGLGDKMIQHFLEWTRTHMHINTSQLDARFEQQLILRSGVPENVVKGLMELIREIHMERKPIDETDLYHLHQTIQQFYKLHS